MHEAIKTTLPKAKELRSVVEPLITLGKTPTLANRRLAFNRTRDRDVVAKLFNELGPRYAGTPGWLHAHPEDGFPRRRQRTDGLRGTGRPARARGRSCGLLPSEPGLRLGNAPGRRPAAVALPQPKARHPRFRSRTAMLWSGT
jgi:hypothetical protein